MTKAEDSVAPDAKWVIDACVAKGYDLGLATAGCRTEFVKNYLRTRVDPDAWTASLLASPAFQSCQPYKISSLPPILAYYNLSSAHGCGVLFDQGFNKGYADRTGVGFVDVDITTGLRAKDFAAAEAEFNKNCPAPGGAVVGPAVGGVTALAGSAARAAPPAAGGK